MGNLLKIIIVGVFISFLLIAGPWCVIWAINQLMISAIPNAIPITFNFWNWLAAVILGGVAILPGSRRN
jgi:hypothetical protein